MVDLYWPNETTYMDATANVKVTGPGAFDVPDELEDLYRHRGWEDVPDDYEGDVDPAERVQERNLSGPTRDELVDDTEDDDGDTGN